MLPISIQSFPILAGTTFTLRPIAISDATELLALRSNPEVNRYINRNPSKTMEEVVAFINTISSAIKEGQAIYWGIALNNDNKLIGAVAMFGFSAEDKSCEIGYELLPLFQKRGIMREALQHAINYAFKSLSIATIKACVNPENEASIKLLEKLEFHREPTAVATESPLFSYIRVNDAMK